MNYALYCIDCGSNVTEDGICSLCFYGESVRQIEHNEPPEIDNLMDEFEARIDDRLSRLERGETVLIEGLMIPEPKTDEWVKRLAADGD